MARVLFVCFQNAGKSLIAEAWFNARADPIKARAISAGIKPVEAPYPGIVEVLKEVGLDVSPVKPQQLTPEVADSSDIHIAMGCGCLMPPRKPGQEPTRDWATLPEARNNTMEEFRIMREAISKEVEALVREKGWDRH